jgi:hypothetical protein
MAKLRLIDRWAAFTDAELLALEGALDRVEAHAPVDRRPVAVVVLADEIGAENNEDKPSSGPPRATASTSRHTQRDPAGVERRGLEV